MRTYAAGRFRASEPDLAYSTIWLTIYWHL